MARLSHSLVVFAAACALVLAACGSGDDRSKLQQQISSGLVRTGTSADLASCIGKQAGKLPIDQEKAFAASLAPGKTPDTAAGHPYATVAAQCFAQGVGVAAFRQDVAKQVVANVPASAPAYRSCVETKFASITPQALSSAVSEGGLTSAAGQKLGGALAAQCVSDPAVLKELKGVFLASATSGLKTSKLSPAFQACFVRKAQNVPDSLLRQAVANGPGAASNALGEQFGRQIGKQCLAEGVKP